MQAYNFRLCWTQDPQNQVAFPLPSSYDPAQWALLRRALSASNQELEAGKESTASHTATTDGVSLQNFFIINDVGGNKTDINNGGGMGTDFVGGSWSYPKANYSERRRIFVNHKEYILGLLHFLATDGVVPVSMTFFPTFQNVHNA